MDFSNMIHVQIMLFALMLLGAFLKKRGIITEAGKMCLTDLVMFVTLPCSIIKSFRMEFSHQIFVSCIVVIIVALLIQIGAYFLSLILYPKAPATRKKVLQYATICSNAGVLGNAVADGIFGATGLLYASIYCVPQRIFMWSFGLTYFTTAGSKKELIKKVLTHPCILAVFIGFPIMLCQIPLPTAMGSTIDVIAAANTPLAMLVVGSLLPDIDWTKLYDKTLFYYTAIRLLILPGIVYLCCYFAHIDSLVTGVCVVLSGMPTASTTALMATKYQADQAFAIKAVVFTTLLSVITIPLWCIILFYFSSLA